MIVAFLDQGHCLFKFLAKVTREQQESGWFVFVLLESLTVWMAPVAATIFVKKSLVFPRSRLGEEVVTGLASVHWALADSGVYV